MSNLVNITVKSKVLLFARKTAGFSVEEVVAKLKRASVQLETVKFWEEKDSQISLTLLRELAKYYKRPLAFFFLKKPPVESVISAAFRRLPAEVPTEQISLSPAVMFCIRCASRAQEITYEIGMKLQKKFKRNLPKVTLSDDPVLFARKIRNKFYFYFKWI